MITVISIGIYDFKTMITCVLKRITFCPKQYIVS